MNSETQKVYNQAVSLIEPDQLELIDSLLQHLEQIKPDCLDYSWGRVIHFRSALESGEPRHHSLLGYKKAARLPEIGRDKILTRLGLK